MTRVDLYASAIHIIDLQWWHGAVLRLDRKRTEAWRCQHRHRSSGAARKCASEQLADPSMWRGLVHR